MNEESPSRFHFSSSISLINSSSIPSVHRSNLKSKNSNGNYRKKMGSLNPGPELSLDFKPTFIPKTISQFLGELSRIGSISEKILKVDELVDRLEAEMRKIDAFKRELPLCMHLINDAIVVLKEESMVYKKSSNPEPVLEEFIPLKKSCDEDSKAKIIQKEKDNGDKKNWLSSTQLWNTNDNNLNTNQTHNHKQNSLHQIIRKRYEEEGEKIIDGPCKPSGNSGRTLIPFNGHRAFTMTRKEDNMKMPVSGLSLISPGIKNPMSGNSLLNKTGLVPCAVPDVQSNTRGTAPAPQPQPPQPQTSRKQRRCWSTELHRRFVNALQQLGGSQAATPKQIRELMQVESLTNDEVKSHLQKYRLHTRRLPSSNTPSTNPSAVVLGGLWMPTQDPYVESSKHSNSQSGSPDGPLLNCTTGGTSNTASNSMDDGEEEKSENNCWKGHLYTSSKDKDYV